MTYAVPRRRNTVRRRACRASRSRPPARRSLRAGAGGTRELRDAGRPDAEGARAQPTPSLERVVIAGQLLLRLLDDLVGACLEEFRLLHLLDARPEVLPDLL